MSYYQFELQNGMIGKVDKEDWPEVLKYKWRAVKNSKSPNANWYIRGNSPPITGIFMHRMILKAPPKSYVDHINGDGLDNRRSNIRLTNALGNALNRKTPNKSGYKGVQIRPHGFEAKIQRNGKKEYLGSFKTEIQAALAFDIASLKDRCSYLNFPREIVQEIILLKNVAEAATELERAFFNREAWSSWKIGPLKTALAAWRELKAGDGE